VKLATVRLPEGGTAAVRIEGDTATRLDAADVGEVLRTIGLEGAARAHGAASPASDLDFAPLVTQPGKIVCVGLNYKSHILEMKRDLPEYPTLFAKFANCLLGANDDIPLPPESDKIDWEAELAVVIGANVRRATDASAEAAIAGYSVCNDISMRDWQFRTREWLQGKMWANSTPLGPVLATPDEVPANAVIETRVDGVVKQHGRIDDLVHGPVHLVKYISTITELNPGDVIITGTTGGVGHAREPQEFLAAGQTVTVSIEGIGELVNRTVAEDV
jgi:acylpyruvate hydrolase